MMALTWLCPAKTLQRRANQIMTKVSYFSRACPANKKINTQYIIFPAESDRQKLNKTNLKILKLLSSDARIPIIKIASAAKITKMLLLRLIPNLKVRVQSNRCCRYHSVIFHLR